MNPENSTQEFADSAKTPQNDQAYFGNEALNSATREMIAVLTKEVVKEGPVKPELVTLLRMIQSKQLYAGERDENGRQVFKSFDHYIKTFRKIYVAESGGNKGDRYKHVKDALLYNRLKDAGVPSLPQKNSVLRKLTTVEPELQIDVWLRTLKETNVAEITPAKVVEAAHALGDNEVKFPPPTASSEKPKLREAWTKFKDDVTIKFGPSIQRHFPLIDVFLEKKSKTAAPALADSYLVPGTADAKQPSQETAVEVKRTAETKSVQSAEIAIPVEDSAKCRVEAPHQYKLNDFGESTEGMKLPPRPFVTSQGGRVYIAFESKSHLLQFVREGMPHPGGENKDGPYEFKARVAGGVWELRQTLSGHALSDEVDRIAQQLEAAAAKIQAAGKAA